MHWRFLARAAFCVLGLAAGLSAAVVVAQTQALPIPTPGARPAAGQSTMPPAAAPASVVRTENVRAELVSEVAAVEPGRPFWVGLHQTIRPKWHTYWRNPGDSGLPTTLEWTLPEGARAGEIVWPHPERFRIGPVVNYGYKNDVLLLVEIVPPATLAAGSTFVLTADANWLVCEDVCVPEEGRLTLALPVAAAARPADPPTLARFEAARRAVPMTSPWAATYAVRDVKRLTLEIAAPNLRRDAIVDVYFFPEQDGPLDHSGEQRFAVGAGGLRLDLPRGRDAAPPDPLRGVLTIRETLASGGDATQAFAIVAASGAVGGTTAGMAPFGTAGDLDIGLWQALLFAVLGGLILNLMPCVFPVLSMKALALAGQAGAARGVVRGHALAYTAGVLASFAAIAVAIGAVRAGGEALGWGFQFQSPLFTLGVAWLFFVLGLNLAGLFEIGGRFVAVGSGLAQRGGAGGSFFTGILATVVATPCTAPFMGAALGFALAQPFAVSLAVLLAMGLGLALPYLALGFAPALLRVLPRPGAWMTRFKQFLAFPMFASAAWLVWVLGLQTGADGVLAALIGMVLLGFAIWAWRVAGEATRTRWTAAGLGAAALALVGVGAAAWRVGETPPPQAAASPAAPTHGPAFEAFSRTRLAELRAQGKPVFVNFTAAWCITCLANERVALATGAVRQAFAERGVVYLKGDWTNRDPEIAAVLREFGRAGVPLYLFYPAGSSVAEPTILPQILTESAVLKEIGAIRTAQRP